MSSQSKRDRAVVAAADIFLRYGFARTTMGDIARAADMSRPALYLLFEDKEAAFEAAVLHLNVIRIAEIRDALSRCSTLRDRLFTACDLWLVNVYDLRHRIPDAADMDNLAFAVTRRVYAELQGIIAELLAGAPLSEMDHAQVEALARNLVFAVRGLGTAAQDVEDMRAMTRLEVDMLCRALGDN